MWEIDKEMLFYATTTKHGNLVGFRTDKFIILFAKMYRIFSSNS